MPIIAIDQSTTQFRLRCRRTAYSWCRKGDVPEPPDEAVTQPGDLWLLGNHRLLCGDSSNAEDVDRLLDGAAVHLVNTDPPYNVKVEPRSNNAIAAGLSSFQGTTLRGLLLEAYAFSKIGAVMMWGAIASFMFALIMSLLVGLGFWHAARTPEEARVLERQPVPVA